MTFEPGDIYTVRELAKVGKCTVEYVEEVLLRIYWRYNRRAFRRIGVNLDFDYEPDDLICFDVSYMAQFREDYKRQGGGLWT